MSHSQFHSIDLFILRHAWLNLWDKRMLLAESTRLLSHFLFCCKTKQYNRQRSYSKEHCQDWIIWRNKERIHNVDWNSRGKQTNVCCTLYLAISCIFPWNQENNSCGCFGVITKSQTRDWRKWLKQKSSTQLLNRQSTTTHTWFSDPSLTSKWNRVLSEQTTAPSSLVHWFLVCDVFQLLRR